MKNLTAYLVNALRFELRDTEIPEVGEEDVLVEMKHVGLCGSDVTTFHDPPMGGVPEGGLPVVLGHECAGIVIATGRKVTDIAVGDRVALEPGIPCGRCEQCMSGRYNLCPNVIFMAAPPFVTGAFSRYVAHPARFAFKLPNHVSTVEGALVEPLAVGLHAATRGGAEPGKSVVILGSGCIGLMTLTGCKARGVDKILVADLYDNRLEMASKMGASVTVNVGHQSLAEEVRRFTEGKNADLVFETAGNSVTAGQTVSLVKYGGRIIMVGNVHGKTPFDFLEANNKEADIISVFRYRNIYPLAIEAIASGRIDIKPVVSRIFPFENVENAFLCALNEKRTALKVIVEF